jgi:DNA-binding beta-propeller fold protein YncE
LTLAAGVANDGLSATVTGTPTAVITVPETITVSSGGFAQASFAATISDIEVLNAAGGIGTYPTGIVSDTVDKRVFAAATRSNAVDAINASTNPVTASASAVVGLAGRLFDPVGLAYGSATLFASNLVTSQSSRNVVQVSPPLTGTGAGESASGCTQPEGVAEDSGASDVWVGCYGSGSAGRVAVFTPAGGLVGSFVLGSGHTAPTGVAGDGTAGHVVVADGAQDTLFTVDSSHVVGFVGLPSKATPANVAYANVGGVRFDYVADPGSGEVSVVDETTDTAPVLAGNITLPAGAKTSEPYGVASDGSSVLVVSYANNARALVYSLSASAPYATLLYTLALPASAVPDGVADVSVPTPEIAGSPDLNLAFIGDEADNSVTIIDPPARAAGPGPVASPGVARGAGAAPGLGAGGADAGRAALTLGSLARDPRGTALSPARAAAIGDALAPPPAETPVKQAKTPGTTRRG